MKFTNLSAQKDREYGGSGNFYCYFIKPNTSILDDSIINDLLLAGDGNNKLIVCDDISFGETVVNTVDIEINKFVKLTAPTFMGSPSDIAVTFIDDHKRSVRKAIRKWYQTILIREDTSKPNISGVKIADLKKYILTLVYVTYDKLGNIVEKKYVDVIPKEYPTESSAYSANDKITLSMQFTPLSIVHVE